MSIEFALGSPKPRLHHNFTFITFEGKQEGINYCAIFSVIKLVRIQECSYTGDKWNIMLVISLISLHDASVVAHKWVIHCPLIKRKVLTHVLTPLLH